MKLTLKLTILLLLLFNCKEPEKQFSETELRQIAINDSIEKVKLDSITKARRAAELYNSRPWKTDFFVDDFGDDTDEKYIYTKTTGHFSNSATSKSKLFVEILIKDKSVGLFLKEYRETKPSEKFIGDGEMLLKNNQNIRERVLILSEWNSNGGMAITGKEYRKLITYLESCEGTIKVVVKDNYSSMYNFELDMRDFNKELEGIGL